MILTVKFNQSDNNLFQRQFKRFKPLNKQLMTRLKKNDIDNYSYNESEAADDVLIGSFKINDPELKLKVSTVGDPVFFSN